jgi:hypothetical protein
MTPNISKELKKATEALHATMLALQTAEADMMRLRDAFVKSTDEVKKEKLKPALIAQAKKVKTAEEAAKTADATFHKILSNEPEEVYDLLDHKIHEHTVRLAVRKIVKEAVNEGMISPKMANGFKIGNVIKTQKGTYTITGFGSKTNATRDFEAENENGDKFNLRVSLRGATGIQVAAGKSLNFPEQEEMLESVNEDVINEGPKPRSWNTMFAMNAIAAYEAGKFDPDDNNSLAAWEKDYNGGVKPNPGFETYDIIAYALTTGKKPDGKPINESVDLEAPVSLEDDVMKFFDSNKKKFEKCVDNDEWDEFYELGYEKFPDADQDKVAQALNKAAMREQWFGEEDENEMPTEKDLELAAYGEKNLQKGVNTSDYDKKAKLPKNPENIKESKKK